MLIKLYKDGDRLILINKVVCFVCRSNGTLDIGDEKGHQYLYSKEDYDWVLILR